MKCLVCSGGDSLVWIRRDTILTGFDLNDLGFRESQVIQDCYLSNWFYADAQGRKCFLPPVLNVVNGSTQFISGRHRTAVLLKHLEQLPMAFAAISFASSADRKWLLSLSERPIEVQELIELPDLPVLDVIQG